MEKSKRFGIFLSLFLVLLVACQTAPYTERKRLLLISESQEVELGTATYEEIMKEAVLSDDSSAAALVKEIGERIAEVTDRPEYSWEFNLIEDDEVVNAFCLPGGKVAVYTGIMELTQTEAELACVIGHEIAHAIARHGGERMSQLLLVELGGMALEEALKTKTKRTVDLAKVAYGAGAQLLFILPYSRTHESEADYIGLVFMAKAGYDPRAALEFWRKMQEFYAGQEPPEFLSTHPSSNQRIRDIEKWLPEVLEFYEE